MDNNEKVVLNHLKVVCEATRNNKAVNLIDVAKTILVDLSQPKVKLPKVAFEWMEETKKYVYAEGFTKYLTELRFGTSNSIGKELFKFLSKGGFFLLVDAYRYGYELEETEEDRIKRNIRETLHNGAGVMISDELVDSLYNIAKGNNNV